MEKSPHYLKSFKTCLPNSSILEGLICFIIIINTLYILSESIYTLLAKLNKLEVIILYWSSSLMGPILMVISGIVAVSSRTFIHTNIYLFMNVLTILNPNTLEFLFTVNKLNIVFDRLFRNEP
ncbi:unnamed protein product [Rhizophagus irregularis]|nr:unnamed protein product [Rhizophagus irregularis]CAB5372093.1 unnamed protein product [Rhizophagus irregularis]